ncbi:MAG TPA: hypothetical protein VGO62_00675 [Myxococcota bacterium]|jgi:hypothetical protein
MSNINAMLAPDYIHARRTIEGDDAIDLPQLLSLPRLHALAWLPFCCAVICGVLPGTAALGFSDVDLDWMNWALGFVVGAAGQAALKWARRLP